MGKGSRNRARRAAVSARSATVRAQRELEHPVWPALAEGIPGSAGTRVRLARPEDDAAIRHYLVQATEDQGINNPTKAVPTVCPSIQAGLERGQDGFLEGCAEQLHAYTVAPDDAHVLAGFSLVAVDDTDVVVGAITVAPPWRYLEDITRGLPPQETKPLLIQTMLGLAKVIGVAVRDDLRGNGIGGDLVHTALRVINRCGTWRIVFGSCESKRTEFYRRLGFNISALDDPIDTYLALGIHALISTPGHHTFSLER